MKKRKVKAGLFLSLMTASLILAGCGANPSGSASSQPEKSAESAAESSAETTAAGSPESSAENSGGLVDAADLAGNTVQVPSPENLNKIVITSFKGAYGSAVLLGQIGKVTGMADNSKFIWLRHAFPQAAGVKNYGSFDDVNIEELLQDKPDVIISPSASTTAYGKMKEVGLPVMIDGIDVEDSSDVFVQSYDEIDLVARLTGTTDKAKKYHAWADGLFDLVKKRVADIPKEDRVTVLPIRTDINQVFGNNCIWGYVVEMAGGINLSGDATANTGKFFADVDAEQLAKWNPDMMFQINFNGEFTDEVAEIYNNWAKDPQYAGMSALESGDVYLVPKGIDYWNAAIEAPLCVLWMAKIMYPDRFQDVDVKAYAQDFYKEYLGYDLNEEDWALIAPQFNGAKENGLSAR